MHSKCDEVFHRTVLNGDEKNPTEFHRVAITNAFKVQSASGRDVKIAYFGASSHMVGVKIVVN